MSVNQILIRRSSLVKWFATVLIAIDENKLLKRIYIYILFFYIYVILKLCFRLNNANLTFIELLSEFHFFFIFYRMEKYVFIMKYVKYIPCPQHYRSLFYACSCLQPIRVYDYSRTYFVLRQSPVCLSECG